MKYFFKFIRKLIRSSTPLYQSIHQASIVFEIFFWQDCIHISSKDNTRNSGKEHNPVEKTIRVSYFFMRNPYKKFQNNSIHVLCHASKSVTNGQTDERRRSNMPLQLLRSWGHNENSCHTEWVYRLIWVFAGYTGLLVGFAVRWLKCQFFSFEKKCLTYIGSIYYLCTVTYLNIHNIQSTLVISNSLISNNRLSRSENGPCFNAAIYQ